METRAKKGRTRLGMSTNVELLKRQLQEWQTLLDQQKQARKLIPEEEPPYPKNLSQQNIMLYKRIYQQQQLSSLTMRQFEERQQMDLRHQQEMAELNQVLSLNCN